MKVTHRLNTKLIVSTNPYNKQTDIPNKHKQYEYFSNSKHKSY